MPCSVRVCEILWQTLLFSWLQFSTTVLWQPFWVKQTILETSGGALTLSRPGGGGWLSPSPTWDPFFLNVLRLWTSDLVNSPEIYLRTIWYDITFYNQRSMEVMFACRKLINFPTYFTQTLCLVIFIAVLSWQLQGPPRGFGKQGNMIFCFKGTRDRNFDKKLREQ